MCMKDFNNAISQINIVDNFRIIYSAAKTHILFKYTWNATEIDHIQDHNSSLNMSERIK